MAKAERVVAATEPMEKINQDSAWYQCRFCDHHPVCHRAICRPFPAVPARTPRLHDPVFGSLAVRVARQGLTADEQKRACDEHLFIPPLVGFAEPVDAGEGWSRTNGATPDACSSMPGATAMPSTRLMADEAPAIYTSVEMATNSMVVGDEMVDAIKTAFDARVAA